MILYLLAFVTAAVVSWYSFVFREWLWSRFFDGVWWLLSSPARWLRSRREARELADLAAIQQAGEGRDSTSAPR